MPKYFVCKEIAFGLAFCVALVLGVFTAVPAEAQDAVVSFRYNVQPILQSNCVECHRPGGQGYEASGLALDSYAGLMRGTRHGPVIVAGDVMTSNLLRVVTGQTSSDIRMPFHRMQLPLAETQVIQRWIQQGAHDN